MRRFELGEVRDIHRGESACILGNGPSLKRWTKRLPRIGKRHLLLGTNMSWTEVESPYHFVVAGAHWRQFARGGVPGVRRMFALDSFLHKSKPQPQGSALEVPICYIKCEKYPPGSAPPDQEFDCNIEKGTRAKFVPWLALQVGLYMGIETFYLLGIDEHNDEGHHHDEIVGNREHHLKWWKKIAAWLDRNPSVRIFNSNPDSAVRCFPFGFPEQ